MFLERVNQSSATHTVWLGHRQSKCPPGPPAPTSDFWRTKPNVATQPRPAPEGMVGIPGGEFSMGSEDPTTDTVCGGHERMRDARLIHRVFVDGFWMDKTDVPAIPIFSPHGIITLVNHSGVNCGSRAEDATGVG